MVSSCRLTIFMSSPQSYDPHFELEADASPRLARFPRCMRHPDLAATRHYESVGRVGGLDWRPKSISVRRAPVRFDLGLGAYPRPSSSFRRRSTSRSKLDIS